MKNGDKPPARQERPDVEIDDPNDWQKLQRLREIAAAKEEYKQCLREARAAASTGHTRTGPFVQRAHGALIDYIQELLPSIEKAEDSDTIKTTYDYWAGVHLGSIDLPEPPFSIDISPDKIGGEREVVAVNAIEGSTEFVGLASVVNSPSIIPVECVYKTHVMESDPRGSVVEEYLIPLDVIQRAGMYLELFRDEVGLDLEFKTPERRVTHTDPA